MRIDYLLAETYVSVRGRLVTTLDKYGGDTNPVPDGVTVEVGVRGDEGNGLRSLEIGSRGADNEFSLNVTPDGRISGVTYKTTGIGGRVTEAAGRVLAFVGGLGARVGLGAATTVDRALDGAKENRNLDRKAQEDRGLTPEEKAAAAWALQNETLTDLRGKYRAALSGLATGIYEARAAAAAADTAATQLAAMARARRLERLLDDARREIATVDDLYRAWRRGTIVTREAEVVHVLAVEEIPARAAGTVPQPGGFTGNLDQVWRTLGVTVQIEPADGYTNPGHFSGPVHLPPLGTGAEEERTVRWRVPRPVRLSIWRREPASGLPILERSVPHLLLDQRCTIRGLALTGAAFGSRSATVAFDSNGVPTSIARTDESGVGAFADALAGLPAAISGGLETADKVQASVGTLLDAGAERRAAAAKRAFEQAQTDLNARGLAATAEDFARAKRLEQQVTIAAAEGALAPPSEAAVLEAELREVTARHALATARREESLEYELGALRSETARLQALVAEAAARAGTDGDGH